MMKRIACIVAALTVLAGFSACTDTEESPADPSSAQEVQRDDRSESAVPEELDRPITEDDFDIDAILDELTQVHAASMKVVEQMEDPQDHAYLPTKAQYQMMADEIGRLGVPVAGYRLNMPNYQQVVDFCRTVEEGEEGSLSLYQLSNTMSIADAFYTRGGKVAMMTGYYDFPHPGDETEVDPPHVGSLYQLDDFHLTDKGYLSVTKIDTLNDSLWGSLYRVLPYDDKLMELTEKYPLEFDRHFSNLMDCNWDADHLDDLHLLEIFITFYRMYNSTDGYPNAAEAMGAQPYGDPDTFGENDVYHYGLPALLVEETLQKHLPVTTEYLRSLPGYDADLQVYDWCMVPRGGVPPTPEVVDYEENADGSLTLYIDAVGDNSGNDQEWSIVLTVGDNPDGSVFYFSCATTFYEVHPYAYLQGWPAVTDPEELVQMEDEPYRRLSQIVGPYVTQPRYDWEYAGDGLGIGSRLGYVLDLMQNGGLEHDLDLEACFDAGAGVYELPRDAFDGYLHQVFDRLVADDAALEESGLLSEDGTLYRITMGESAFDGVAELNWVEDLPEGGQQLTVHCYDSDGGYLCQLTFAFASWTDNLKIESVEAQWMGSPPARP